MSSKMVMCAALAAFACGCRTAEVHDEESSPHGARLELVSSGLETHMVEDGGHEYCVFQSGNSGGFFHSPTCPCMSGKVAFGTRGTAKRSSAK